MLKTLGDVSFLLGDAAVFLGITFDQGGLVQLGLIFFILCAGASLIGWLGTQYERYR